MRINFKFAIFALVAFVLVLAASCGKSNETAAEKTTSTPAKVAPTKKTMYRSTMSPNEVSDKPGKDSMGMDMVPFEVEESGAATEVGGRIQVKISSERQQLIGIRTTPVQSQAIHKLIKAVGHVDYAETNLSVLNLKFDGWLEKLYVNSTGRAVRRGEPLFDIYSPELVSAEQEYLIAVKSAAMLGDAPSILKSARDKLRLWDISGPGGRGAQPHGASQENRDDRFTLLGHRYREERRPGTENHGRAGPFQDRRPLPGLDHRGDLRIRAALHQNGTRGENNPVLLSRGVLRRANHLHLSVSQTRDADQPSPDRSRQSRHSSSSPACSPSSRSMSITEPS